MGDLQRRALQQGLAGLIGRDLDPSAAGHESSSSPREAHRLLKRGVDATGVIRWDVGTHALRVGDAQDELADVLPLE